jgi:tetratricopeptide (TPR) repeat protein
MSDNSNGMPVNIFLDILIRYSKIVALIASLVALFTRQFGLPNILTYLIVGSTYLWIAWVLVGAIRSDAQLRKLPFPWLKTQRRLLALLTGLSILTAVWFGYYGWSDYRTSLPQIRPAAENEILIIISDFDPDAHPAICQKISKPLEELATTDCGNPKRHGFRVCRLSGSEIIQDEEGARRLLHETRTTLVIWGSQFHDGPDKYEPHMLVSQLVSPATDWTPADYPQIDIEDLTFEEWRADLPEYFEFLAAYALARVFYAREDHDTALMYLNRALSTERLQRINSVVKNEDWGAQYAYFTRALVKTARGAGNVPMDYRKALELDDEFAAAYNNLGNFYMSKGYKQDAIDNYSIAAELNMPIALFNLGNLYAAEEETWCQAMENYDKAVERLERSYLFMAYHNRGALQLKLTNYQLAWEDLNNAIQNAPKNQEKIQFYLYNSRAKASLAMDHYHETVDDLDIAITRYGEDAGETYLWEAHSNKGEAYVRLGEYEQAIKDLQDALGLIGGHHLIYYNLASAYSMSGQVDEATRALNEAIQLESSNATYAACDPDFDDIREHPLFPSEVQEPDGGCPENANADTSEINDPCQKPTKKVGTSSGR